MIKALVFIARHADISLDAFIRYYEEHHVPMVDKLLPYYSGYRRNYMMDGIYPQGVARPFDAVTELMFASEGNYQAWVAALQDEAIIAQIRKDEENFIDSAATMMWIVREEGRDDRLPI